MQRLILALFLTLGVAVSDQAQNPVVTTPSNAATPISPNSAAIGVTNTFQKVFDASVNTTGRVDCLIQNQSASAKMYIYFGLPATATTPNSLQLAAAEKFRCANSGVVIRDAISITGTSGDRYFAAQE